MANFALDDLYDHPHDRGVLTYAEWLMFCRDWERAGRPVEWEDVLDFLATTAPWKDMEVWWITNTVAELQTSVERR